MITMGFRLQCAASFFGMFFAYVLGVVHFLIYFGESYGEDR
jgi:hypothetical protein